MRKNKFALNGTNMPTPDVKVYPKSYTPASASTRWIYVKLLDIKTILAAYATNAAKKSLVVRCPSSITGTYSQTTKLSGCPRIKLFLVTAESGGTFTDGYSTSDQVSIIDLIDTACNKNFAVQPLGLISMPLKTLASYWNGSTAVNRWVYFGGGKLDLTNTIKKIQKKLEDPVSQEAYPEAWIIGIIEGATGYENGSDSFEIGVQIDPYVVDMTRKVQL